MKILWLKTNATENVTQMETDRLIKLEGTFSHHFFSGLEMEEKYTVNTTSQLKNVIQHQNLISL